MGALEVSAALQSPVWVSLTQRAEANEDFRRKLVANPAVVLAEVLGTEIPPSVKIQVHENSATEMNVVLDPFALAQLDAAVEKGDAIAGVIKRAATDKAFRNELTKNPQATIKVAIGVELPPGLKLNVYENTPTELHLLLPAQSSPDGELSDMELEAVAGGRGRRPRMRTVCNVGTGVSIAGCGAAMVYTWGGAAAGSGGVVGGAAAYSTSRQ